jgi:hypothetical protein
MIEELVRTQKYGPYPNGFSYVSVPEHQMFRQTFYINILPFGLTILNNCVTCCIL